MNIIDRIRNFIRPVDRWTRPVGNDWVDLTQEQCIHVQNTGTCPYCGTSLFGGPSGGASQNLFCGNLECDTRLNVSEMIPWGQFTGGVPADFRSFLERRR